MPYPFSKPVVTIASGQSLSAAVAISAGDLVAIEVPAGWTAAAITFQASVDNVNFFNLFDDGGNEVKIVVASGNHVAIGEGANAKAEHFRGAPYMKIRSGTAAAPVNQVSSVDLALIVRKMIAPGRFGG